MGTALWLSYVEGSHMVLSPLGPVLRKGKPGKWELYCAE